MKAAAATVAPLRSRVTGTAMPLPSAAGATASTAGSAAAAATSEPPVQELLPKTTSTVQTTSATSMYLLALASQPTGLPWKVLLRRIEPPGQVGVEGLEHDGGEVAGVDETVAVAVAAGAVGNHQDLAVVGADRQGAVGPARLAAVKTSGTLVPEGQARLAVKLIVTSVPLAMGLPLALTVTTPTPAMLPVPPLVLT